MDEFRDDGTRVCPIHGLRFDPEMSEGCIKCGRPSQLPKKRSTAPSALSRPPTNPAAVAPLARPVPPPRTASIAPLPRRSSTMPPMPLEPMRLANELSRDGQGAGQSLAHGGKVTLLASPEVKPSRRGLILGLSAVALGGSAFAAWWLSPEGPADWSKRVTGFRYGPGDTHEGALFVPSSASEEARPLLVLLDPHRHPAAICLRYARHCEKHGWIAISTNAVGGGVNPSDGAEVDALLAEARARAKVDAGRPIVAGFDVAAETACRLPLVQPEVFGGAILECVGLGPWRDVGALAQNDVSFFLFTRSGDPSREKMVTMKDEMERKGLRVGWSELPGGHEAMDRDELDPAFAWLDSMRT